MLIHDRLAIFYQVVRHGGIAAAARRVAFLPNGNAINKQILLLERDLGVRLFDRSPFRLTKEGRAVYRPLPGMADILNHVLQRVQSKRDPCFRIGVEDELRQSILIPAAVEWLKQEPDTKVNVETGSIDPLQASFADGELDFLLTLAHPFSRPPPGTKTRIVGSRPLVLLVHKDAGIRKADDLWRQKRITGRLAAPAQDHPVIQSFRVGLRQGNLTWPTQIVTDSLTNILPFVAAGLGMGVTLDFPANTQHPDVKVLPMSGFAPVSIACHWRTPKTPQIRTALRLAAQALARS